MEPEFQDNIKFVGRPKKYFSKDELNTRIISHVKKYRMNKKIPKDEKYYMSPQDRENLLAALEAFRAYTKQVEKIIATYTHKSITESGEELKPKIRKTCDDLFGDSESKEE